jgi:hypothetical protein
MHRHLFFEFRKICVIHFANFSRITTKSLEVSIMANDDNTIFCNPYISLEHGCPITKGIFKSLKSVFRSFPASSSMSYNDVTHARFSKWNHKFSSLLMDELRHFSKELIDQKEKSDCMNVLLIHEEVIHDKGRRN